MATLKVDVQNQSEVIEGSPVDNYTPKPREKSEAEKLQETLADLTYQLMMKGSL